MLDLQQLRDLYRYTKITCSAPDAAPLPPGMRKVSSLAYLLWQFTGDDERMLRELEAQDAVR